MVNRMVFGVVVTEIAVGWAPEILELVLALSVSEPVEAHVHCFRFDLLAVVVGNRHGCAVVGSDGCLLLVVA